MQNVLRKPDGIRYKEETFISDILYHVILSNRL
jgi:hypothetical protein